LRGAEGFGSAGSVGGRVHQIVLPEQAYQFLWQGEQFLGWSLAMRQLPHSPTASRMRSVFNAWLF
jgi:hypothetical protein